MYIKIIKHKNISKIEVDKIAFIKDQYWIHGIESQIKWINSQFLDEDIHMLLYEKNEIVAYVGMNQVECTIDRKKNTMCGVGNVCVERTYQGTGLGIELMHFVNDYIKETNQIGILLCHKKLCKFYSQVGWQVLNYAISMVDSKIFTEYVMTLNCNYEYVQEIEFNKNF